MARQPYRLIINLDPSQRAWLEEQARSTRRSLASVVREAVQSYRAGHEQQAPSFDDLLRQTSGTWSEDDGLAYQQRVRREWDRDA